MLLTAARMVCAQGPIPAKAASLEDASEIERAWEDLRRARDVTYSAQAHIRALANLLNALDAHWVCPLAA